MIAAIAWRQPLTPAVRIFWAITAGSNEPLPNWFAFRRSKADEPAERMQALLEDHGSIYTLAPLNDAARDWLRDTAPEHGQFWSDALVIEPRHVRAVIEGFEETGGDVVR